MTKRIVLAALALILGLVAAAPAAAGRATVDRLTNIETVLAVAMPDDFPVASLMRAECAWVHRVELPNGSARETMVCELSDERVMIPEFQGSPPARAFRNSGGPCVWFSDYWFAKEGSDVLASSFRYVVTPSGHVTAHSWYPAEPLDCS
jgi:hypothetical protein